MFSFTLIIAVLVKLFLIIATCDISTEMKFNFKFLKKYYFEEFSLYFSSFYFLSKIRSSLEMLNPPLGMPIMLFKTALIPTLEKYREVTKNGVL